MTVIPTGFPGFDHYLGGGFPTGLVFMHGDSGVISKTRTKMYQGVAGHIASGGNTPLSYMKFPEHVARNLAAHRKPTNDPTPIILDLEDVGPMLMQATGHRVSTVQILQDQRNYAVSCIRSVCLLMEAHSHYNEFQTAADLVLHANRNGSWKIEKSPLTGEVEHTFDPTMWAPPAPVSEPAPTPRVTTSESVIAALAKHPVLAWQVARQLQVLGPWVLEFVMPAGEWVHKRRDPWDNVVATLSSRHLDVLPLEAPRVAIPTRYTIAPRASGGADLKLPIADAKLRELGYILVDEKSTP